MGHASPAVKACPPSRERNCFLISLLRVTSNCYWSVPCDSTRHGFKKVPFTFPCQINNCHRRRGLWRHNLGFIFQWWALVKALGFQEFPDLAQLSPTLILYRRRRWIKSEKCTANFFQFNPELHFEHPQLCFWLLLFKPCL